MNIRNTFFLMAAVVAGLYVTGCTEEDGIVPGGDGDYGKPSNLQATSISGTQIKARWHRASDDVGVDTLIAVPVGGGTEVKATTTASSTDSMATVSGLTTGVSYNLYVAAQGTAGRTGPIVWMTANRFGPITLYETADNTAGDYSGLDLSTGTALSTIGGQADQIDIVLATDNGAGVPYPYLSLQAADVAGSGIPGTTRLTRFGNNYYIVDGGLNNDFYSASFASEISTVNYINIDSTMHTPIILLAKTADLNYARIEIMKQANGYLWKDVTRGANTYRAIDVMVSYQPTVGIGIASRPAMTRQGSNSPKVGGARAVTKY